MASEPAVAYMPKVGRVQMSFDLPDTLDEETFRFLMVVYAKHLAKKGKAIRRKRTLSDEELSERLQGLPSFDEGNDATASLTKEDYTRFMRVRKPIKGIDKWL